MKSQSSRIIWLDMAKGYGIILVIIGHCDMPYLTDYIYAFHMPLFFFLSGYVYSIKTNIKSFIKAKIKRIIVPYFCLSIPMLFANMYFSDDIAFDLSGMLHELELLLLQERYTTMWFIACLLMLNIIMYPLASFIKCKWKADVFSLLIFLLGLLLWHFGVKNLPWNFDAALVVLPFFYIGYRLKEVDLDKIIISLGITKVSIMIFMMSLFIYFSNVWNISTSGEKVDFFYSNLNEIWLTYIVAFIGIAMMSLLSMKHSFRIIRYIGENSLLYFAWHQAIILPILSKLYWKLGLFQWNLYRETSLFKWISVIITLLTITVLNKMIIRSKLKFVLGK